MANRSIEEMKQELKELNIQVKLARAPEEKEKYRDAAEQLKKEINAILYPKSSPKAIPHNDIQTVGQARERRIKGKRRHPKSMINGRFFL